ITVSSVTITGAAAGDYSIVPGSDSCTGISVAVNSFCVVGMVFKPSAEGLRPAVISFTDNGTGSPQSGALIGRGVHTAGYWLSASDGGIFSFPASTTFYGSTGSMTLIKPIVGIAATPDSGGYWEVASDGGIFAFGDAGFFGSTGSIHLNKPVVGVAPPPAGGGYWLGGPHGGIFAFGDAAFEGSLGSNPPGSPIVYMAPTPDNDGYWLLSQNGTVYAFGDARNDGSLQGSASPATAMAASPSGGYWILTADGTVHAFGGATNYG